MYRQQRNYSSFKSEEQQKIEEETRKKQEFNEENFPTLGNTSTKMNVWGGTKTFAELAAECAKQSETEDIFKKVNKQPPKEQPKVTFRRTTVPLPQFNNIHRYVEQDEELTTNRKPQEDEEGWIEVRHTKRRRQKTFEEIVNRPVTPEEGDTVWDMNAPEEHETCWDEQRP